MAKKAPVRRYRIPFVKRFLDAWPGKQTFGLYRFLPVFFVLGATLEFSMIKWEVGNTNFYNTFKRRRAEEIVEKEHEKEQTAVSST